MKRVAGESKKIQGEAAPRPYGVRKPMRRGLGGGSMGVMSSRIASKTTLNCESYFFSISASLRARSLWEANISRSFTNARMISMFTCTARSLFKTLDNMATPCSVKA